MIPNKRKYKAAVPGRLDRVLAALAADFSRSELQKLIRGGSVAVNGKIEIDQAADIWAGDRIEVVAEEKSLAPLTGARLDIVYEDEDLMIVDKPPGIVVHPTKANLQPSIAGILLAIRPQMAGIGESLRPGIAHRLDADTSGLLVVAKSVKSLEYLQDMFRARKVEKFYSALVHGIPAPEHGLIDRPIGRHPGLRRLTAGLGRNAVTEYWSERYFQIPDFHPASATGVMPGRVDTLALLRIQLHTGRTHQIRVHFESIGHPIAGDRLYGGRWRKADAAIFPRQFLHAARLSFRLPSGKLQTFESPLPADLQTVLDKLEPFYPRVV